MSAPPPSRSRRSSDRATRRRHRDLPRGEAARGGVGPRRSRRRGGEAARPVPSPTRCRPPAAGIAPARLAIARRGRALAPAPRGGPPGRLSLRAAPQPHRRPPAPGRATFGPPRRAPRFPSRDRARSGRRPWSGSTSRQACSIGVRASQRAVMAARPYRVDGSPSSPERSSTARSRRAWGSGPVSSTHSDCGRLPG
jgi:hypothetical protein